MIKLMLGRAWRRINRTAARAWLRTQVKPVTVEFERYGTGHNAWWVLKDSAPGSIAYCGGVGLDANFDFELAEKKGMAVFSFDPTPSSIDYMERRNNGRVSFHPWGMLDNDQTTRFYSSFDPAHKIWFVEDLHGVGDYIEAQCFTVETIMKKLGHDAIDLLKIDIEGSWEQVLLQMLSDQIFPRLVCVEFDSPAPILRVRKTVRALQLT